MERKTRTLNCASFSCMKGDVAVDMTLQDAVEVINSKRPARRRISSDALFSTKKNFYLSFTDNVSSQQRKRRSKGTEKGGNTAVSRQDAAQVAASVNRFQHRVALGLEASLAPKPVAVAPSFPTPSLDTPFRIAPLPPASSSTAEMKSRRRQTSYLKGLKRCAEIRRLTWENPQSAVVGDAIATVARTVFAVRSDFISQRSHTTATHLLHNALPLVGAFVSIRRREGKRILLTGIVLHETLNAVTLAPCAPKTGFTGTTKTMAKSGFTFEEKVFAE